MARPAGGGPSKGGKTWAPRPRNAVFDGAQLAYFLGTTGIGAGVGINSIYTAYLNWARRNGLARPTRVQLASALRRRRSIRNSSRGGGTIVTRPSRTSGPRLGGPPPPRPLMPPPSRVPKGYGGQVSMYYDTRPGSYGWKVGKAGEGLRPVSRMPIPTIDETKQVVVYEPERNSFMSYPGRHKYNMY